MKFAVIVFPGSNCDRDCYKAVLSVAQDGVEYVRHTAENLDGFDMIILPGGFSYGDYLRAGAIASYSPVMKAVRKAAFEKKPVLGICNGFQILTEAKLLPGALIRNHGIKFCAKQEELRVENNETPFTSHYKPGERISIPIAHGEGNYTCDQDTLDELKKNRQILFRYEENPNGSIDNIAGICNKSGNVMGMMPHPERAVHNLLGSIDGKKIFTSILSAWRKKACP